MKDFFDVVFDGPPGPESGRFVEVENEHGASISVGEWVHRQDGYWALRIQRSSARSETAATPPDRSDAVNLARNVGEFGNVEDITRRGLLTLVDAVLQMDEWKVKAGAWKQIADQRAIEVADLQVAVRKAKANAEAFERELKDGDRLCEAFGVSRTEAGWLNVPKHIQERMVLEAAPVQIVRALVLHNNTL